MCCGDVADEVCRTDEISDAPAGAVEILPRGTDGEGLSGDFGAESGDAGEGGVREAVVDLGAWSVGFWFLWNMGRGFYLVREDKDVMFDAEVADGLELGFGEDFADGVVAVVLLVDHATGNRRVAVRGVEDDHLGFRVYGFLDFLQIYCPVCG